MEMRVFQGAALKRDDVGVDVGSFVDRLRGPFLFTDNSFQLTAARDPTMTWIMRAGNIVSGVARTLYLVRKENENCVNALTATKELP
jgi:hypothetical protein